MFFYHFGTLSSKCTDNTEVVLPFNVGIWQDTTEIGIFAAYRISNDNHELRRRIIREFPTFYC